MKIMIRHFATLIGILCMVVSSNGQVITREDSLNANLIRRDATTLISGYGEVQFRYDLEMGTAEADLTRNVLFLGHKFNNQIALFSEMEIEHALISTEDEDEHGGGELAMEQLFLKFNLSRNHYLTAGLFIPRIGIINENHLPTTYNGNQRPQVEQQVIPTTWREIGIGYYGTSVKIPGLNYSAALVNGLRSESFEMGEGIAGGRGQGNEAQAGNLAVTGAVLYFHNNWRFQVSGYFGGSAGLSKREADSLQLEYGVFGTPVELLETSIQYLSKGFSFKALAAWVNIPDADAINRAYASNTAQSQFGAYGEVSYNILNLFSAQASKKLPVFARLEWMDLDHTLPANGIANDALNKIYFSTGLGYMPAPGVIIKADYQHQKTGDLNTDLLVTPFPQGLPYRTSIDTVTLGIGYSF